MKIHLNVWRQKNAQTNGKFETYDLDNISEDMSFLEMLDVLNEGLINEGKEPVVYMSEIMEGVLDATDEDGWMAKNQLYNTSKYAIELHGMIGDTDNLEPWVQAKITKANDYLSAVKHYMEYLAINEYPAEPPVVVDDMPDEA